MAKTIFLHFGLHKTGTTSIQSYINTHKSIFKGRGFRIIQDIKIIDKGEIETENRANCFQLAHVLIRPKLNTIMRLKGIGVRLDNNRANIIAKSVNNMFHKFPEGNIVLSSESFSFLRTAVERDLLSDLTDGFQLRPIGFFRNKSTWMQSWRAQVERSGILKDSVSNEVLEDGTFDFSDKSWLLDHDKIREFFGKNGHYFSYDDTIAQDGTVIPQFLRILGLDPIVFPSSHDVWLNRTLSKKDNSTR
ncbi:hypothetical protein [Jiella sonneratiae]|uniref:Sulfotransferase family protein n=1 Tax=Jiella sonneratiae TaxID=2816856 RepID=A0ABS3J9Y4_9HYPH|nr:hypothetical protein [Jiella sonneratiae]MBO0905932.1 hypothetical protein [Jiella sonneratiae]